MDFAPLSQIDIDQAPTWMRSIPLRPDRWRDAHTRAVLGMEGDDSVAVGIIWTSRVHGDRYLFEIAVHPEWRGRGYGRDMFERLSELRASDIPFMARGYADDERMSFVRALGARTVQIVPPARIETSRRDSLRNHPAVRGASRVTWDEICAANAEVYLWTHATWNPVGQQFASALNENLGDELDLDATSVAIIDDRIAANCMVYNDSIPPILTAETVDRGTANGEQLVEGCVRRSLDILASRGITEVEFDGHVTDTHFLPIWTRLSPGGQWFHLVEVDPIVR